MRQSLVAAATLLLAATPAFAGPLLYQHGGRATAQVGAYTARSTDAVAIAYNPAAIARLPGASYQAGFDFTAPRDDYESDTGSFAQDHLITETPALYASWHLPEDRQPFAIGIGIDSRSWYLADWHQALFPGRFVANRQEMNLYSIHPVVAYQLGERWSIGGGVRYYLGQLGFGNNAVLRVPGTGGVVQSVEVERRAETDVDGLGMDLGLHYGAEAWGWGLVFDTGAEVEGNGDLEYEARDVPADTVLRANLDRLLVDGSASQSFDLPWELRTGFWVAPYPELRMELDLAWVGWSVEEDDVVTFSPNAFPGGERLVRRRDWNDTVSVRLGLEGDVGDHWVLSTGLGWEPSPIPSDTVDPGYFRSDAFVVGLGISYQVAKVSLDLGYSFHFPDDRSASGQELLAPHVNGHYESRDQIWAFSASWRR